MNENLQPKTDRATLNGLQKDVDQAGTICHVYHKGRLDTILFPKHQKTREIFMVYDPDLFSLLAKLSN